VGKQARLELHHTEPAVSAAFAAASFPLSLHGRATYNGRVPPASLNVHRRHTDGRLFSWAIVKFVDRGAEILNGGQ
jgi:hypothetical protein